MPRLIATADWSPSFRRLLSKSPYIVPRSSDSRRDARPGIVGSRRTGAESIVLSGGYVDDADYGSEIIYTGHGGRDPATGRQVADQEFTRQNQALVTSCLEGLPVRVVRGADPGSAHAPDHGYRYDGVYWVDSYWRQTGTDGFMVCRFRPVKEPELRGDVAADAVDGGGAPAASAVPRVEATILRVV
jgi:putative restriction endonuclease